MTDRRQDHADLAGEIEALRARLEELEGVVVESETHLVALRQSEERYRFLAENISDVIFTVGLDLQIGFVSASALRLTGWEPGEVGQLSLAQLLTDSSYEEAVALLGEELGRDGQEGVEPTRSRALDVEIRRQDGSTVWAELKVSFLRDEGGNPSGLVGVARDISGWKQTQEALRHSEERLRQSQKLEAVGQLAGGIAHDFNNILTVIIGNAQLLLQGMAADAPGRFGAEEIEAAAQKASSLTGQLLAFSRKQLLRPELLEINDVVLETRTMLRRLIGEDVALETSLEPGLPRIRCDRGQLEQVILNLAVNARDAMPDGGRLTVSTSRAELEHGLRGTDVAVAPGSYVCLSVSDTGMGIPLEHQSRVFEPFFTTKEVGKGTGLGLATVYGVVKQSGGYIWLSSRAGEGTTFDVYLPLSEAAPQAVERKNGEPRIQPGRETVLLVEDEAGVRNLAGRILREGGYQTMEAASGEDALTIAAGHAGGIDLLVTDIVMPGINGYQLAEHLLQSYPEMRVLLITGHLDDARMRAGLPVPGARLLKKPFTPALLLSKVREILDSDA